MRIEDESLRVVVRQVEVIVDDAGRIAAWRKAIGESDRMAEAFMEFVRRPDPARVLPL